MIIDLSVGMVAWWMVVGWRKGMGWVMWLGGSGSGGVGRRNGSSSGTAYGKARKTYKQG
ncbi:hypothetical protein J6590_083627 [Homalodisca vitripennis]|nr:hypothetical protein J6590_083627 [Homalodisca vitripennis]